MRPLPVVADGVSESDGVARGVVPSGCGDREGVTEEAVQRRKNVTLVSNLKKAVY